MIQLQWILGNSVMSFSESDSQRFYLGICLHLPCVLIFFHRSCAPPWSSTSVGNLLRGILIHFEWDGRYSKLVSGGGLQVPANSRLSVLKTVLTKEQLVYSTVLGNKADIQKRQSNWDITNLSKRWKTDFH